MAAVTTVYTYALNGGLKDFNIPFEYLARRFVDVTLIGVDRKELVLGTDFRFTSKSSIQTTLAWGTGDGYNLIEIRRNTSATDRLVDFSDGSILRAYELNTAQIQTMHVAEEARNAVTDTIGVNTVGDLDARGRKIANLGVAVKDTDAITYGQVKGFNNGAYQSSLAAKASETKAKTSETNAKTSETNALAYRNTSETHKNAAATSASEALSYRNTSEAHKNAAATSASEALSSKNAAATSASEALSSKNAAATSAAITEVNAQTVLQHIASYGANPVGTVVMGVKSELPGHLLLNGDSFDPNEYPELYAYLGTDILPSWQGRYPKGATVENLGSLAEGSLPAHTHGIPSHTHSIPAHTHTGSTSSDSHSHSFSATTSSAGAHSHTMRANTGTGNGSYVSIQEASSSTISTNSAGAHTHSISGTTGSDSHSHSFTTASGGGGNTGSYSGESGTAGTGSNVETDRVHVNFFIKAKGLAQA